MNHKRGRPKSKRAGCLLCKPHKHEAARKLPRSPSALAVITERPHALPLASWWVSDEYVRFGGDLVVDLGEAWRGGDEYFLDDDWSDCPQLPHIMATPLRVTLAEVAE